jgi:hypothetical protein
VGAVATANIVLENTGTGPTGDITKVFGNPSPQFTEAAAANAAPSGTAARARAQTDFVGLAVHCAQGSAICATGQDDALPAEPGGYGGFKALFGALQVNPVLTGRPATTPLTDLLGQPITDPFGQPGFPGFDGMSAAVSLAYVVAMQEAGIPVTYAYISDAHDNHGVAGNDHVAYGPGAKGYVDQLKAYDSAFATFFDRLAAAGITPENTLFVFTVDEGDHFVGVQKTGCDGITTPCVYAANEVGEISANIDTLVAAQFPLLKTKFLDPGALYAFTVHGDDAPPFYLAQRGVGPLGQTDPVTREFERTIAKLTAVNPYRGATDSLMVRMADQTGMKSLHMFTTGDPARNGTFVFFADPNYFLTDFPPSTCQTCINPLFAWNHGDIQPEIATTWLGFVGPGVRHVGRDSTTWSDHVDVRPTILSLVGLQDSYAPDGRVLVEALEAHAGGSSHLARVFKQINAPFGELAMTGLTVSTAALTSETANDAMYTALETKIADWTRRRDALAAEMQPLLPARASDDEDRDERAGQLITRAEALLSEARRCAADVVKCSQ